MAGKKGKNNNGVVAGIIVFIAILVIGAVIFLWIMNTPGYINIDKAVENYFTAVTNEDTSLYKKTCYTSKWQKEYNKGQSEMSLDEQIANAFTYQSGATYSDVKVVSVEKLDKSISETMHDKVSSRYGANIKVSQVKKVNFTVNMVFDGENSSSGTLTRYCYKSGGKWFFLGDPDIIVDLGIEN